MPIYQFQCRGCGREFSLTFSFKERDAEAIGCPGRKNRRLEQLMTGFFANTCRKS